MDFRLLGPVEASDHGAPVALGGPKQRALLALLLLSRERVVAVDRLVDDLWGEDVPESAVKMVQIYVSQLRKVLPAGLLVTRTPGYAAVLDGHTLDLTRFEQLALEGRAAMEHGAPEQAAATLREALELWRGPALAEFEEPFAAVEAARLEELRLACLEDRLEADLAAGRHRDLVAELEPLVARHPLRERLRRQQLLALYRSGRQADALAAYAGHRRFLDEELGIEPSAGLRELERRMLLQDPGLDLREELPPTPASAPLGRPRAAVPARLPQNVVGREHELARLDGILGDALAGERQVVFVTGEAGIGKTTLVDAFLARVSAAGELRIGRGQCIEHRGAGEAYLPVLEALGRLARDPGEEELVQLLARGAPTWLVQLPSLVPPAELQALQARMVGTTSDRMLREMVETLDELAAQRPTVLVIEDVHWADYSTLDLIDAVARRREPARLAVLATFRPPGRDAPHPLHGMARNLTLRGLAAELQLGELATSAVADYLERRFPPHGLPEEVVALVHRLTRGSPLFVEKVVETWLDEERVAPAGDGWHVTTGLDDLARSTPDSLRQLIEQRLADLEPVDRAILEAASVAGSEFAAALVADAADLGEDETEARCAVLARAGALIEQRGETEWPDGTVSGRFGFTHDLCQEVIYRGLPPGRRARLHVGIGARLERAHGARADDVAPELAFHFARGRAADRAVVYLGHAAAQALRRAAAREARDLVEQALTLLAGVPDGPPRLRAELTLVMLLGPALIATRGWSSPEAEQALLRARELAERTGADEMRRQALFSLGTLYEVQGRYLDSEALIEEALALAGDGAEPGRMVECHELLACSLFHQGRFDRALGHADDGASLYDGEYTNVGTAAYGDNPGVACHTWAGLALWFLGRPDEALQRAERAVTLASEPRRAHGLATAQVQAAIVSQLRLDPERTLVWAEDAIATAERSGFRYRLAMARILRGWALAARGATADGIGELERGLEESRLTGARMDDPYYMALLADARIRDGRHREALDALSEGLSLVQESRSFFFDAELHRLRGAALVGLERPGDAEAAFEEALAAARRHGTPALELRAAVDLAALWRADGREAEAAALVSGLYGSYTEGLATADLVRARALLTDLGATPA